MSFSKLGRIAMGLLLLSVPEVVAAQTSGSGGSPNVPVLASGQLPSVTPLEDRLPGNVLQGMLVVGANYDDNALPNVSPRQWDVTYSVMPQISLQETRPRFDWAVSYSPGLQISQEVRYRNQFAQRFSGNLSWRTSPHGTLSIEQYYFVSTNPFGGFSTTQPGPGIAPNTTVFIPNARQKFLLSHALYSYQSSAQTTMGIGGRYQLQKYDNTPHNGPTTALVHGQIASGEAYIARQLTPRNQLGIQYSGQVLKFPQANARTTTHTFSIFDQMNLSSRANLTLYGGPEYSLTSNQVALNLGFVIITIPVKANAWSASGGAIYSWTGGRLATLVDFSRGISDGGGLLGAVELTHGSAELSWRLTRNWRLTSTISGSDEQLLAVKASNELRTYSGQFGLSRQLWRDVSIESFYQRLNQSGSIAGFTVGNRDIVGARLEYSFLKPLGD